MAKIDPLTDPQSLTTTPTAIASNNDVITAALTNTLSLDGSQPNAMLANLDMNGYRILNLPGALTDGEPLTLSQFTTTFALIDHNHDGVYTKPGTAETITANWNFTGTPTYNSIEFGYRVIPLLSGAGGTAATTWRGKSYASTSDVTIPASTFAAGDSFVIYNNSESAITITRGANLAMYNYGTDSATLSLGAHDTMWVWFHSATVCVAK